MKLKFGTNWVRGSIVGGGAGCLLRPKLWLLVLVFREGQPSFPFFPVIFPNNNMRRWLVRRLLTASRQQGTLGTILPPVEFVLRNVNIGCGYCSYSHSASAVHFQALPRCQCA